MSVEPKDFSKNDFLGHLIAEGLLDKASATRVRTAVEISGAPVERAVLELSLAGESEVFSALAKFLGLAFVATTEIDPQLATNLGLNTEFLERVSAIPVKHEDERVMIAVSRVDSLSVLQSISFFLSVPVDAAITAPSTVREVLSSLAPAEEGAETAADNDVERLRALANDAPVIRYVNEIVAKAVTARASDIHFEAQETGARVRFRIDGLLSVEGTVTPDRLAAVVSRVKVMAGLNISEKRRPQDGRISQSVRGRNIDIRVSTLPTQYGESVVMRLLDQEGVELDWSVLGFDARRIADLRRVIGQPNGIFLVAGPTGSGKTTTLYTALKEINRDDRKIVTVEDPIEYSLAGVNQTQVDSGIGMTFAGALRAILRQDPDVVMVGEIRDEETAAIAVRAALIGRLVLSTIHTNDSLSAITRLLDLGVPSFLLTDTLRGVLSQRLVGRVCRDCAGRGGPCCGNTGSKGRLAVSEFLPVDSGLANCLANGASHDELISCATAAGFKSMRQEADGLLRDGKVSAAAVERALGLEKPQ